MPSREAEGQPSLDKFNSVGRNSLDLDIFSPVTDGVCLLCFLYRCCSLTLQYGNYVCTNSYFFFPFKCFICICLSVTNWTVSFSPSFFLPLYLIPLHSGFKMHGFIGDDPTSRNGVYFVNYHVLIEILISMNGY